jgi:hypothetical protein
MGPDPDPSGVCRSPRPRPAAGAHPQRAAGQRAGYAPHRRQLRTVLIGVAMRIVISLVAGVIELASIAAFLTVTVGWLAGAAGHLPL